MNSPGGLLMVEVERVQVETFQSQAQLVSRTQVAWVGEIINWMEVSGPAYPNSSTTFSCRSSCASARVLTNYPRPRKGRGFSSDAIEEPLSSRP